MDLKLFAYTSDRYLPDYSLLTSLSLENLLLKIRHILKTRILSYNQKYWHIQDHQARAADEDKEAERGAYNPGRNQEGSSSEGGKGGPGDMEGILPETRCKWDQQKMFCIIKAIKCQKEVNKYKQ